AHLMRRLEAGEGDDLLSAVTLRGEVVVEGHSVGHIEGFGFVPDPDAAGDEKKLVLRAARRALRAEMPRRVTLLENAPDDGFAWTPEHALTWGGTPVGRLLRGTTALRPRVQVLDSEFLDGAERERVRRRLQAWVDAQVRRDLAPLFAAEAAAQDKPALRGPLHRLSESLGLIPGLDEETLAPDIRQALKALGVRSGRFALFIPALLKPRANATRMRLWSLFHGIATPDLPNAALVSLPPNPSAWPSGYATAAGWIEAGPILLRLDIAEKIAGELGYRARRGPATIPAGLASRFAIKPDMLPAVLRRLGFRVLPALGLAPGEHGPPAPAMLLPLRRRKPQAEVPPPAPIRATGPFAALAALRR
ncbi:MAG: DNA helicase, partial [Acetobacteraceae bacterium]